MSATPLPHPLSSAAKLVHEEKLPETGEVYLQVRRGDGASLCELVAARGARGGSGGLQQVHASLRLPGCLPSSWTLTPWGPATRRPAPSLHPPPSPRPKQPKHRHHLLLSQYALLYTTVAGERRIRVHTLALPVTHSLGTTFRGADLDVYMAYVAKKVASQVRPGGRTGFWPLTCVCTQVAHRPCLQGMMHSRVWMWQRAGNPLCGV